VFLAALRIVVKIMILGAVLVQCLALIKAQVFN